MLRKGKKGSAIVFVLMLLVLFAAFTASMMEVSISSKGVFNSISEVKDAQYYAEIGGAYVVKNCNYISLNPTSAASTIYADTVEVFLDKQIARGKQYVGPNNEGWFQVLPYNSGKNYEKVGKDYLVKIEGGIPSLAKASPNSFLSFLDMAYAANEVTVQYEVLMGPDTIGDSGTNPFGGTLPSNPWDFSGSAKHFTTYSGSQGKILFEDPSSAGFPTTTLGNGMAIGQLAPALDISTIEAQKVTEVTTAILSKVNWNSDTFATSSVESAVSGNSVSPPSGDATWGNGAYSVNSGMTINGSSSVAIGDSSAPTYLRVESGDLKVEGSGSLQLGAGQYMLTGHTNFELGGNSYTTIGDPTGNQFTYWLADDLKVEGDAVLVLGPGIYSFSRIEIGGNGKVIMDTTNGPVYLLSNGMLHGAKIKMEGSAALVNFKDTSVDTSTYALATDQANAEQPVGSGGQKVASLFLNNQTKPLDKIELGGSALLGALTKGNQADIWNTATSLTWNELAGSGSEVDSSGNLSTSSPTAGIMQVWGKNLPLLKMEGTATANGSFMFQSLEKAIFSSNATMNGALGFGSLGDSIKMEGNSVMRTDPNINPYPPTVIPGSFRIKWIRRFQ